MSDKADHSAADDLSDDIGKDVKKKEILSTLNALLGFQVKSKLDKQLLEGVLETEAKEIEIQYQE